jgi:U3 small nucleolar RNA-associated protein 14
VNSAQEKRNNELAAEGKLARLEDITVPGFESGSEGSDSEGSDSEASDSEGETSDSKKIKLRRGLDLA